MRRVDQHARRVIDRKNLAHRAASKGLAGLEWAIAVPGTVGGAVYGNAGAFLDQFLGIVSEFAKILGFQLGSAFLNGAGGSAGIVAILLAELAVDGARAVFEQLGEVDTSAVAPMTAVIARWEGELDDAPRAQRIESAEALG